jgi:hypothetical protein
LQRRRNYLRAANPVAIRSLRNHVSLLMMSCLLALEAQDSQHATSKFTIQNGVGFRQKQQFSCGEPMSSGSRFTSIAI